MASGRKQGNRTYGGDTFPPQVSLGRSRNESRAKEYDVRMRMRVQVLA